MSALDDFKKSKAFCVCVDSDGCAMDTMNIKHIRCFGPCMVDEWGLDPWREAILERWNVINLFSGTRGINRFKGLAMALGEIDAQYTRIDGVEALLDWAEHADELSNDSIKKELDRHPIFAKALAWSIAVNKAITALPQEEIKPFDHVKEALKAAHEKADVVVVSSANPEAVREEWKRFGLIDHVDLLCTQEMGSKAYCIARLCEKGYGADHILMCGDAPGDEKAASSNGVLYFPILVNRENESWRFFLDEALERFAGGDYKGEYQQARRAAFRSNLGLKKREKRMEFAIRADAARVPHKKHWQFCVGSGHALLALRTDYTRQLRFIHDTLGIERVRFHGVFNDDMRTRTNLSQLFPAPGAENFTEENFRACGLAYDNVLEAGMKPLVELSFMPRSLSKNGVEGVFFYKPCIDVPADPDAWAAYVQRFLRFLIHRYGADEVRSWLFEVWNEPDLQVVFFSEDRESYFRLYETTARAVKAVDPQIRVGGPATSGSKWIASFLRWCKAHEVPVDFVTTHQYAGDPLGGVEDKGEDLDAEREKGGESWPERIRKMGERLAATEEKSFLAGYRAINPDQTETTDMPDDNFRKNAVIAKKQAGALPLYYTEWNLNAGFASYTNDTRKVAAYDVKTALAVGDSVDGSSLWCFSDIFEELHPFVQEFHGGFGLLSQSGIPKPVYYAMKLLADAPDTRLDLGPDALDGEIGAAAFDSEKELHVLLFRQKMKNLSLPPEEAVVRIELPARPRAVTVRRIDEEHGNPMKLWEELGRPDYLNRGEVEELKRRSAVVSEPWPFDWEDGVLTLRAALFVNDVYGFVIEKG